MADFKSFYGNGGGGAGGQQSLLSNLEVYRINGLYRVIQIIYTYTTQFNRAPTGGAPPEALAYRERVQGRGSCSYRHDGANGGGLKLHEWKPIYYYTTTPFCSFSPSHPLI